MPIDVQKETFTARFEQSGRDGGTLTVKGQVNASSGGWSVSLAEAGCDGFDPKSKQLLINAEEPDGPAIDVITPHEVKYEEKIKDENIYSKVQISYSGGGNVHFTIPVKMN